MNVIRYASAVFMVGMTVLAWAQQPPPLPDAVKMADALFQRHAYLGDGVDTEAVDAVRRDLREAERLLRRNATEEQQKQGADLMNTASSRLLALLQGLSSAQVVEMPVERTVVQPVTTLRLPGSSTAHLFRVEQGAGPARCVVRTIDLSVDAVAMFTIDVKEPGTTWVLAAFDRVPQGRTSLELTLAGAGASRLTMPIETMTEPHGTLNVRVLSDDSGKPCPAMMRMVWKTDGSDVRPANAVDLTQLFDNQGSATGLRKAQLGGRFSGSYWCVPGSFSMSVAPGEYEITVMRGAEHLVIHEVVEVRPNERVERTYQPRRWVDMRDHGWYSGDDHVHTQILSDRDARMAMSWIQAEDVRLANVVKMGDIYRTWFEQRGFGKAYRVQDQGYILSPGQECPRTHGELGHTISMNITEMVRNTEQYYLYDTVFDEVHRQGGLSGYAHVNADLFFVHRDMSINIPKNKIDFVELLQFANLGTTQYYDFLNLGYKVTASAGSDVPWGGSVGEVRVYAYLGKKKFTADRWFEAVRKGHTFVTNGLMLEFTVNGALPGDEVRVDDDKPLRIKAKAWGHPERDVPAKLDLIVHGEPVKSVVADTPDQAAIEVDFTWPPGHGFWIAAMAEGRDGTRAHTTPIYVVKPGFRFWQHERAEELIAKREASLAEVERIVAEAQAGRNSSGKEDANRPVTELAEQGSALLERVEAAKAIYADLRTIAAQEATLRKP